MIFPILIRGIWNLSSNPTCPTSYYPNFVPSATKTVKNMSTYCFQLSLFLKPFQIRLWPKLVHQCPLVTSVLLNLMVNSQSFLHLLYHLDHSLPSGYTYFTWHPGHQTLLVFLPPPWTLFHSYSCWPSCSSQSLPVAPRVTPSFAPWISSSLQRSKHQFLYV